LSEEIRRREEHRRRVIEEVARYVHVLRARWGRLTAILYGSYVRGDFNLWSDVDLVLVSERFRGVRSVVRCLELADAPPRLEPICWTPEEAVKALAKPWWREALRHRLVLVDDYGLTELLG